MLFVCSVFAVVVVVSFVFAVIVVVFAVVWGDFFIFCSSHLCPFCSRLRNIVLFILLACVRRPVDRTQQLYYRHYKLEEEHHHRCRHQHAYNCFPCRKRSSFIAVVVVLYFEGFQLEWCISTIYHCRDTPFWSETLEFYCNFSVSNSTRVVIFKDTF